MLRALHERVFASRPELERLTGLSRATVAALTAELIAGGIVEEAGPVSDERGGGRSGRPAQLLSIRASSVFAIGVDIGHDRTRVMLCDARGAPVWDDAVDLDVDHMPEQTLSHTTDMISRALASVRRAGQNVLGIGVDIASPVDVVTGNLGSGSILADWSGTRPAHELSRRTGLPAQLINDANAGALAESLYGAGRNCDNFVYVRLSAGIGAGILANGQLLLGARGVTGEVGHMQVVPNGLVCRCGNRGCLETVASPVAIANLLSDSWRKPVTRRDLFHLLAAGNESACRAVSDAGEAIGFCVAAMVNLLDPELVIVGGEFAAAGEALFGPMTQSIRRHRMPSGNEELPVISGDLGDSAAVRGAAGVVLLSAPEKLAQTVPA